MILAKKPVAQVFLREPSLKPDTNTLCYSDIAGKNKEHGYYLNVGGSYGTDSSAT
ncbi:hypothetical protein ALQ81_200029 [Pseudomonas syringae pv. pisi]|nr:hypothetical protein ALQ81_200029 [Pseudomonas syringae pv. pisi]